MKFQVFGTILERLDKDCLPSGNIGSVTAEFCFKGKAWENVEKTVIFSTKKNRKNVLIVDDKCLIPEFCTSEESCFATLIGVRDGYRVVTNMVKIWIKGNCYSGHDCYIDPVQNAYEQVLIRLLEIENKAFDIDSKLTSEKIAEVVKEYLIENPIPGATTEQISEEVAKYMRDNPVNAGMTEEEVETKIEEATQEIDTILEQQSMEIEEVKKKVGQAVANTIDTPFTTAYWKDSTTNKIYLVKVENGVLTVTESGASQEPILDGFLTDRLLIWNEEFDGNKIDDTKWSFEYGSCRRKQYYRENQLGTNMFLSDSVLTMKAKRDNPIEGMEWSGSSIHTNNKFESMFGLYEAKLKFDTTEGSYTSWWTLGANFEELFDIQNNTFDNTQGQKWARCGENDIIEFDSTKGATTLHYADIDNNHSQKSVGTFFPNNDGQWHIFGMEWTENKITYYVDRVEKGSVDIAQFTDDTGYNPFRIPHFMILNHGCGNDSIAGHTPSSNVNELTAYCDWIRYYAPETDSSKVEASSIQLDNNTISLEVGESKLLTVNFNPSNVHNRTIKWITSNTDVCTCYGGMIRAKGVGSATVTAETENGKTATCNITITEVQLQQDLELFNIYSLDSNYWVNGHYITSQNTIEDNDYRSAFKQLLSLNDGTYKLTKTSKELGYRVGIRIYNADGTISSSYTMNDDDESGITASKTFTVTDGQQIGVFAYYKNNNNAVRNSNISTLYQTIQIEKI